MDTADYKTLYYALSHQLLGRKDLAQMYCYKEEYLKETIGVFS